MISFFDQVNHINMTNNKILKKKYVANNTIQDYPDIYSQHPRFQDTTDKLNMSPHIKYKELKKIDINAYFFFVNEMIKKMKRENFDRTMLQEKYIKALGNNFSGLNLDKSKSYDSKINDVYSKYQDNQVINNNIRFNNSSRNHNQKKNFTDSYQQKNHMYTRNDVTSFPIRSNDIDCSIKNLGDKHQTHYNENQLDIINNNNHIYNKNTNTNNQNQRDINSYNHIHYSNTDNIAQRNMITNNLKEYDTINNYLKQLENSDTQNQLDIINDNDINVTNTNNQNILETHLNNQKLLEINKNKKQSVNDNSHIKDIKLNKKKLIVNNDINRDRHYYTHCTTLKEINKDQKTEKLDTNDPKEIKEINLNFNKDQQTEKLDTSDPKEIKEINLNFNKDIHERNIKLNNKYNISKTFKKYNTLTGKYKISKSD